MRSICWAMWSIVQALYRSRDTFAWELHSCVCQQRSLIFESFPHVSVVPVYLGQHHDPCGREVYGPIPYYEAMVFSLLVWIKRSNMLTASRWTQGRDVEGECSKCTLEVTLEGGCLSWKLQRWAGIVDCVLKVRIRNHSPPPSIWVRKGSKAGHSCIV